MNEIEIFDEQGLEVTTIDLDRVPSIGDLIEVHDAPARVVGIEWQEGGFHRAWIAWSE